ncbi:hypothetical protein PSHT_12550 [Puccinia striiformis]|uniref:Uncharacterized protein n=1 Tax=Puccinia striiformis TaxID=27350 RepID=A0A2S4UWA7_9BASI|nr:hypothetical protein PSHT_12550 [Puccinia striiformis]
MRKIESLGGKDGLNLLQRKIWETLLCFHMMPKSRYDSIMEERGDGSPDPVQGWTQLRLACFVSMATFLLFGTAGWLDSSTESHNSNRKDVWSLVKLAHAKHTWLYKGKNIDQQPSPEDTPWYRMDTLVRWLIKNTAAGIEYSRREDWDKTVAFSDDHVTKTNIARFALQDIMAEVSNPKKSMSPHGTPAPDVYIPDKILKPIEASRKTMASAFRRFLGGSEGPWHPMAQPDPSDTEDEELYDLYARYQ